MAQQQLGVKMSELAKSMTLEIRITGMRSFQLRVWLAMKLIQLAAIVFPANVNVEVE